MKPEQTTTRSGVTRTPRARATYSASAAPQLRHAARVAVVERPEGGAGERAPRGARATPDAGTPIHRVSRDGGRSGSGVRVPSAPALPARSARAAARPASPSPARQSASPRRRVGRRPRQPCSARCPGRRRAPGTKAGGSRAPAARSKPRRAERSRARRVRASPRGRGADRRQKWPTFSSAEWILTRGPHSR